MFFINSEALSRPRSVAFVSRNCRIIQTGLDMLKEKKKKKRTALIQSLQHDVTSAGAPCKNQTNQQPDAELAADN